MPRSLRGRRLGPEPRRRAAEVVLHRLVLRLALAVAIVGPARPAAAQAWVLPARTGTVTLVVQEIDHVGRMRNDGSRRAVGTAVNYGIDVEVDYAFTDRFSLATSMPYIFSKFTDLGRPQDPIPFPEIDACRCWHSEFADFGLTARLDAINLNRNFMLTPFVSTGLPSHAYEYVGEAVVGRRLRELRIGTAAGQRLDGLLRGLSVQAATFTPSFHACWTSRTIAATDQSRSASCSRTDCRRARTSSGSVRMEACDIPTR